MVLPRAVPTAQPDVALEDQAAQGPRQVADVYDHLAVAAVWSNLPELLSGHCELGPFIRHLTQLLPPACMAAATLPSIALIHLRSASDLRSTLTLLAPDIVAPCNKVEHCDDGGFEATTNSGHDASEGADTASLVGRVPSSTAAMVTTLIDLQLFHRHRAQEILACMRMYVHAQARDQARV